MSTIKSTIKISEYYDDDKIDKRGYFKLKKGVICASMVFYKRAFKRIFRFIEKSELGKFYKPLPIESWAISLFEINQSEFNNVKQNEIIHSINKSFEEKEKMDKLYPKENANHKNNWFKDILDKFKIKHKNNSMNQDSEKYDNIELNVRLDNLYCDSTIGIEIDFINDDDYRLFNYIRNKFSYQKEKPYHVKLAYKYNDRIPINNEFYKDFLKLLKMLERIKTININKPSIKHYDSARCIYTKTDKKDRLVWQNILR